MEVIYPSEASIHIGQHGDISQKTAAVRSLNPTQFTYWLPSNKNVLQGDRQGAINPQRG
jgi:hypothetical protein